VVCRCCSRRPARRPSTAPSSRPSRRCAAADAAAGSTCQYVPVRARYLARCVTTLRCPPSGRRLPHAGTRALLSPACQSARSFMAAGPGCSGWAESA
jgi:hypothetical protein